MNWMEFQFLCKSQIVVKILYFLVSEVSENNRTKTSYRAESNQVEALRLGGAASRAADDDCVGVQLTGGSCL